MAQTVITTLTGVGTTSWISVNPHVTPVNISFGVVVSGSVTYTVNTTFDDPNGLQPPNSANPPNLWPVATGFTSSNRGLINFPCLAVNMQVTAGTGTATLYVLQAGLRQS